jgi:hypothetical protein
MSRRDGLKGPSQKDAGTRPCRGFGGVPQNPPESPFDKGGLRGIGGQGVESEFWNTLCNAPRRGWGDQGVKSGSGSSQWL